MLRKLNENEDYNTRLKLNTVVNDLQGQQIQKNSCITYIDFCAQSKFDSNTTTAHTKSLDAEMMKIFANSVSDRIPSFKDHCKSRNRDKGAIKNFREDNKLVHNLISKAVHFKNKQ